MNKNLSSYLICKLCDCTFDDPIILPCYKIVCSKHVYEETIGDTFKCDLCKNDHSITANGFPKIEELSSLVRVSKDYIHLEVALGENNLKAKELCDEFEKIINKSELLAKDPLCYLYEYFNKVKTDLDMSREKYIKTIDDQYFRILKQIEDAQNECKSNLNLIEISQGLNELNNLSKEKLDEFWDFSTETDIINNEAWYELKYEIEKSILIAEYQLKKFENKLLLNRSYEFKPNENLNEFNIGDIRVLDNTLSNEERMNHTVRISVDDLSKLNPGEIKIIKDVHVVHNIPWIFSAKIKPAEELGELNFYIKINPVLSKKINKVDVKLLFKVVKNDGSISKDIVYKQKIRSFQKTSTIQQFSTTLRKLTTPNFFTYNKENNSAVFELDIEFINK